MIFIKTYYLVSLKLYSESKLFEVLKNENIVIYNFKKKNEFDYTFYISKRHFNLLEKCFKGVTIIKTYGLEKALKLVKNNIFVVFSLVLSLLFYVYANTRIYDVKINGTNQKINEVISNRLNELGIKKHNPLPNNSSLKEIESILKMDLINEVNLLSINSVGTHIFVNYERKGGQILLEDKKGKMYAKKSAIIKAFEIESGKIVKEINDYVVEGELIVDDTLFYKDKKIVIGTLGKVFGYTFNKINISCNSIGLEESEIYQTLLLKARQEILKKLEKSDYIEKEIILSYVNQNGIANMELHYTLVENIVKF